MNGKLQMVEFRLGGTFAGGGSRCDLGVRCANVFLKHTRFRSCVEGDF